MFLIYFLFRLIYWIQNIININSLLPFTFASLNLGGFRSVHENFHFFGYFFFQAFS